MPSMNSASAEVVTEEDEVEPLVEEDLDDDYDAETAITMHVEKKTTNEEPNEDVPSSYSLVSSNTAVLMKGLPLRRSPVTIENNKLTSSELQKRMEALEIDMGDDDEDDDDDNGEESRIRTLPRNVATGTVSVGVDDSHVAESELEEMISSVDISASKSFESDDGEQSDFRSLLSEKHKTTTTTTGSASTTTDKNSSQVPTTIAAVAANSNINNKPNRSKKLAKIKPTTACLRTCCGCCGPTHQLGNMHIVFPSIFVKTRWGIMGPHFYGPFCLMAVVVGITAYLVHLSLRQDRMPSAVICVLFALNTLYQLIQCAYRDPGVIPPNHRPDPLPRGYRWCDLCQGFQPPNGAHCSDCNVCIAGYDHHCVWMGTCIGCYNFKHFVRFNVSWLAYLVYAIVWVVIVGPLVNRYWPS